MFCQLEDDLLCVGCDINYFLTVITGFSVGSDFL